ncbi:hypothetical protein PBY51_022897 [Eleginops maclovinus]|uniref:Uncharacterized protein n=1 Tax=Eleginops maclovinus TaxID=56733 RepID=A0AAN8AG50_ELEMC|nr:hypothetical protein PBY51_022897 [Eleginops maclovinus]
MSTTASSASVERVCFVLSSRLFVRRSRTTFVDQQGHSCDPLIKADWGLSSVSPSVQQAQSVWDYHTCGSGINPIRDMGTRDKKAPKIQGKKGGGPYCVAHPRTVAP